MKLTETAVSVAAMSSVFEALVSFSRPARGSIFYNVPLKEGLKFDMNWSLSMQGTRTALSS